MPPDWREFSCSSNRLKVGPHHTCHTTGLRVTPKIIVRALPRSPAIPQGLNRYIEAYLIPVSETVHHSLGSVEDPDLYPFNRVFLHTRLKCRLGKTEEPDGKRFYSWSPRLFPYSQPDFKWSLRSQVVKTEGRKQTNHAVPALKPRQVYDALSRLCPTGCRALDQPVAGGRDL